MATLYLVRHGQASFGAENYDQLSPLGEQQSFRLGQYFKAQGLHFDAAFTGTLSRQRQTLAGICEGLGLTPLLPGDAPAAANPLAHTLWSGLNEFDGEALIATLHPQPLEKPDTPELYRQYFRLLRQALKHWMDGVVSPQGMPSYDDFVAGVTGALTHIRKTYSGNVLLVSSGGPISTAVGHVLATSPETTIELNLRIRNSSVTEFTFTPKRHTLMTFNTLPHLDTPEHRDWVTYA